MSEDPKKNDSVTEQNNDMNEAPKASEVAVEENKETTKKKGGIFKNKFLKFILAIVFFPITILIFAWKFFKTIVAGGIKTNFLEYLFSKEIYDKDGNIVGLKTIELPEVIVSGHFLISLPIILAIVNHFCWSNPVVTTWISFAMIVLPILAMIIALFDIPILRFWVYIVLGAILIPLTDYGYYALFGIDFFACFAKGINHLGLSMSTGTIATTAICWFVFLLFPLGHSLLQKRILITPTEVIRVRLGGNDNVSSKIQKIQISTRDAMESIIAGTGDLVVKTLTQDRDEIRFLNVPGLGSRLAVYLFTPWAIKDKKTIMLLISRVDGAEKAI